MASIALLKAIDRIFGPILTWASLRVHLFQRRARPGDPVLVIRPGGLGDAIVLLPALAALRETLPADVRIDILCEPRNQAAFTLHPLPNTRILLYTRRPWSLSFRLHRAHYAAVLDTEQSHWFSALFADWTAAPVRIGFNTVRLRSCLYTDAVPYDLHGPEREQFQRLFRALPGASGLVAAAPPAIGGAAVESPPFAALHLGGSNPSKHWPEERYAALCDALAARAPGLRLVLLGGKADRAAALRAATLCHTAHPEVLAGTLPLSESAALCASARLFIGPDSGLAHLAEAAGTYAVVLFGSGDPAKWGPAPDGGRAVTAPAGTCPCAPCSRFGTLHRRRGCRYECIASISVEAVLDAIPKDILP